MAAGNFDFLCEQGATFSREITWADEDGVTIPNVGYVARMMVREKIPSAGILVTLTTENGGITLGGMDGKITVLIPATTTATFPAGPTRTGKKYQYDLELQDPSGYVTRLLQGAFRVSPEVTR